MIKLEHMQELEDQNDSKMSRKTKMILGNKPNVIKKKKS